MAVHPTANIEPGVRIGRNTDIWDHVHVRHSTSIGSDCIIGEKSYLAYGVEIKDRVKINAFVYICTGVTIEQGVMIAAHVVFTNDRFPRATTPDLDRLLPSDPDEHTLHTVVREGATIGANATIGPGLVIGRFAMIGMGSVVTRDVPDFAIVQGNPARAVGYACACGQPLEPLVAIASRPAPLRCHVCTVEYEFDGPDVVRSRVHSKLA
jgi:UDP-2-acetamido-3-amino-2,3-dideoxy-glucuronate N-acetyltransferase